MLDERTSRFLSAFNAIDAKLRALLQLNSRVRFGDVLEVAENQQVIDRFLREKLRRLGPLRNAIVHGYDHRQEILATPCLPIVKEVEHLRELLVRPPTLNRHFLRKVVVCGPGDDIGPLAHTMYQKNFSQVPVYEDAHCIGLLTAEAVARWFGDRMTGEGGVIESFPVREVLDYTEKTICFRFLAQRATVFDALRLFEGIHADGQTLAAIIITPEGIPEELPTGIITASDVPKLTTLIEGRK